MFTSVCTTSSYCRMLEGERGEERGKSQTRTHKVQLEPSSPLCWVYCSSKTNANSTPLPLLRHEGPGRLCRKPKARGTLSLPGASQPAQPAPKEPNPSSPHSEQESRAGLTPGQAQAKQLHSLLYFTHALLESGRRCSAEEREQQPRAVRGGQSLPPKRRCSQTHLDSSPVASTPKCSHTAGQNCSLQVMKSSSRLARAEERVNNPGPFPEEPPEIPMVLFPSLWEKALETGTFGSSTPRQITRKVPEEH